jgi:hypothetical protein
MRRWRTWIGCLWMPFACASQNVPEPREALQRYETAVREKNAAALHALLSADARRAVSVEDVKRWLEQSQPELQRRARVLVSPDSQWTTRATVRYVDGETATLTLEQGEFKVDAAAALPASARTPQEALSHLRRALAGRNYPALTRILTPDSARALESKFSGLVNALEQPQALPVQVEGNRASVVTADGHRIELEQEDGVWRVRDFE